MGKSGAIGPQVCAAVHFILGAPQANGALLYHVWLLFSPDWLDNLLPLMNESSEAQLSLGFSFIMWTPCCRRHSGSDSRHPWGAAPPVTGDKLLLESTASHLPQRISLPGHCPQISCCSEDPRGEIHGGVALAFLPPALLFWT